MNPSQYIYNYKRSPHYDFAIKFNNTTATTTAKTLNVVTTPPPPTKSSLADKIPFIYDQGKIGSCVSCVMSLYISYLNNNFTPSRLFIYYNARLLADSNGIAVNEDSGISFHEAFTSIETYIPPNETLWRYEPQNVTTKPPATAYDQPILLENFTYTAIPQIFDDFRHHINDGFPIMFSILIYESFETAKHGGGKVPPPDTNTQKCLGGHSVLMVGYDDTNEWVICANSWGYKWGDGGFFYLPYQYVLDEALSFEFYIMKITNTNINIHPRQNRCCDCGVM